MRKNISVAGVLANWMSKLLVSGEKMDQCIEKNDHMEWKHCAISVLSEINSMHRDVKEMLSMNCPDELYPFRQTGAVNVKVQMSAGFVHILLDAPVPKRIETVSDRSHLVVRDYCSEISNAILAARKEGFAFPRYKEKVVICYFHRYTSRKWAIDYDNYDTKLITDTVALHFLIDDSPRYLCGYHESFKDNQNATNIWIIPVIQFPGFLKKLHEAQVEEGEKGEKHGE